MPHPLPHDDPDEPQAPLVRIGLAVLAVLMVPMVLYSGGPEGPVKAGDVVFATDRHRVALLDARALAAQGYQHFCILEPDTQLVIQKTGVSPEGSMMAEVIGQHFQPDVPYCPSRTPVILFPHQITLKANLWENIGGTLSRWFSGS